MLAVLFAIGCVFLSNWQFERRAHRVAQIAVVEANYDAKPVAIESLLNGTKTNDELSWRPVVAIGRFLNDKALLVRNRPQNGQPGFELVVPFATKDRTLLVDLGWLPTGNKQDSPDQIPLPSTNAQRITVRLAQSERKIDRDAPSGQVANVDLPTIAALTEMPIDLKWYGQLASGSFDKFPRQLSKPSIDEGSHLSYAIQWVIFALLGFATLVWAFRKELNFARAEFDPTYSPPRRKTTRSDRDAEAEDA
jgi:cytochrome oxidase assembly protein ShyY1